MKFEYLKEVSPTLDKDFKKIAQDIMYGTLKINLHELESLVNPDKFEFPDEEIGPIGVKIDR